MFLDLNEEDIVDIIRFDTYITIYICIYIYVYIYIYICVGDIIR